MTTPGLRRIALVSALAALLVSPAVADAQSRQAVRVARPRPPAVVHSHSSVGVGVGGYYRPYYRPYPYHSSWYFPFSFSFSYGYPYYSYYGAGPYYGAYPYGPYPYAPAGYPYYDLSSSLRLQVTPREAEVYIDGYYAGTVDNFDGVFQRLHLEPGQHDLELFMSGYRSFTQKVYLQPVNTFNVRHAMEPLAAGEPAPERPVAPATPPPSSPTQANSQRPPRAQRPLPPERPVQPRASDGAPAPGIEGEFGTISLRVQPGDAVVTIDGERWEGSQDQDRLVVQLAPGVHTVQIRKDGYRTYITDLTVRRSEATPLNVSLTRQ